MNKIIISLLIATSLLLTGCGEQDAETKLRFSTSAEYPPFEYKVRNELTGFDIELARMIAEEMGKEAEFVDMQFSAVLVAVQNGMVDAAISTITITDDRKKNFDFSEPYYIESMAMMFPKNTPITERAQLPGKKIATQLGTTMEIWLREHAPQTRVVTKDNNLQAIEALKAGHVDGVLIDAAQAVVFSQKNPQLDYAIIAQADSGYAIAFKKGSPLTDEVNTALQSLREKGAIQQLQQKYLESDQWQNS